MTARGGWPLRLLLAMGAAAALFVLWLAVPFNALDRFGYDLGMRLSGRDPAAEVVVVGIDTQSVAELGPAGWSRSIDAQVIDTLAAAGARVIGYATYFPQPSNDASVEQFSRLDAMVQGLDARTLEQMPQLGHALDEARRAADADGRLVQSVRRAGNVVLPVRARLDPVLRQADAPPAARDLEVPVLPRLAEVSAGVGFLNLLPDQDAVLRRGPLVIIHDGEPMPAFALQVASRALGFEDGDLVLKLGQGVALGQRSWATDPHLRLATYFYPAGAFETHSFVDVYRGRVSDDAFRGRVVLVGPVSGPAASAADTPRAHAVPETLAVANAVSTLLRGDAPHTPHWANLALAAALGTSALLLALVLPRVPAWAALLVTALAATGLGATQLLLMSAALLWVPLAPAACLLLAGYPLARLGRAGVVRDAAAPAAQAAPAGNRILALAYQGQGQLDLAFEQFRKCPMDAQLMDNLYNLALDHERRRQYNKAQAVFEFMAQHDPKYRDLEQRASRHRRMLDTSPSVDGLARADAVPARMPQSGHLGRYEIERELGKGAMGVVYLGRDPKIGRTVAIKTLALSSEFEAEELEKVRERFFREAETAGRLIHPNIVTIFDAGEEQDLAYFAMEYLSGHDLSAHVRPETLLPLSTVISIVARVADALDYAHGRHVVHRDVKPGNIMYDAATDTVKVTDFGVARITDSSRTKTGIVLGTPSFMSPEQLAGHKIDGLSDLFSLGVTLYQLCCGALPFKGDTMAQLMYRIANDPPVDPLSLNRDLPEGLVAVIHRAMAKRKQDRFQSGAEMAQALRMSQTMFTSVDLAL